MVRAFAVVRCRLDETQKQDTRGGPVLTVHFRNYLGIVLTANCIVRR